jgi:hypothetical protein
MDRMNAEVGSWYVFRVRVPGRRIRGVSGYRVVTAKLEKIAHEDRHLTYTFRDDSGEEFKRQSMCFVHPKEALDVEGMCADLPPIVHSGRKGKGDKRRFVAFDNPSMADILSDAPIDEIQTLLYRAEIERLQKLKGGAE